MQKAKGTPAFLFLYTNLHKIKDSKIDAGFCHLSSKWLYIITDVWLKFFFPIDFFFCLWALSSLFETLPVQTLLLHKMAKDHLFASQPAPSN